MEFYETNRLHPLVRTHLIDHLVVLRHRQGAAAGDEDHGRQQPHAHGPHDLSALSPGVLGRRWGSEGGGGGGGDALA